MTETSPLTSVTYALTLLYWLIVYGLAGYAVKHLVEVTVARQHATAPAARSKPKRRR